MNQIVLLTLLVCIIDNLECRGLKEEFTWTRMNYLWPGNSHHRTKSYHLHHPDHSQKPATPFSDSFLFPGSSNAINDGGNFDVSQKIGGITYSYGECYYKIVIKIFIGTLMINDFDSHVSMIASIVE